MQKNEDVVNVDYVRTFCVCGEMDSDVVVGVKGDILIWKGRNNNKADYVIGKVHDSYIYSLITICDNINNNVYLLSASNDAKIKIWLYCDYSLITTLTEHTSSVISLTYNNKLNALISSSADTTICLWSVSFIPTITFTKLKSILHTHIMFYSTISSLSPAESIVIACGKSSTLYLYSSPSYALQTTLHYHSSFIYCFIFTLPITTSFQYRTTSLL